MRRASGEPVPEHSDLSWIDGGTDDLGFTVANTVIHDVHPPEACAGRPCVIHNPSDHHMRGWPIRWRCELRIMERICPHGNGHPDPDDDNYRIDIGHGLLGALHRKSRCDGCCDPTQATP